MSAGPQRTSGAFSGSQGSAHREERHTPATHPTVGEEHLFQGTWDHRMEKNKVGNGDLVRLRIGLSTLATFSEAVEILTVSGSIRSPESDVDEREHLPTRCCAPEWRSA